MNTHSKADYYLTEATNITNARKSKLTAQKLQKVSPPHLKDVFLIIVFLLFNYSYFNAFVCFTMWDT